MRERLMEHADLTAAELFDAAVSYSRRRGKLKAESDADPGKSRSTGQTFVLAAADSRVIDRIPLDKLYRDAEKMQDTYLPDISKIFPAIDKPAAKGETVTCPFCKEQIITDAVKCKHCGSYLEAANKSDNLAGCLGLALGPVGLWYKGHWFAGFAYLLLGPLLIIATGGIGLPFIWLAMGIHAMRVKPKG
jgi:hypothetical protein